MSNRAEELSDGTEVDAYDDQQPEPQKQPVKAEKPRGKCTGCAFEYQLGTARTGDHKGKPVIRKHNSRTGPGLCSGASAPPYDEQDCACGGAGADDGCPNCSTREHCVPGRCEGCCGCSSMCTTDPCGQPGAHPDAYPQPVAGDVVGVAPGGTPIVAAPTDLVGAITTDPWSAPAPASLIPESTTTVSGQPEPDRDSYGRYKIHGQAHTRATTFAKLGANTKAIEAWNERNVVRGLTLRPDLLMLANGLEVKKDRQSLNSIAAQAKDAAGSKVAANIGTAYHAFSERVDAGLITPDQVPNQYGRRVRQYVKAVAEAGLTTRPEWIERTTAVRADQVGAPLPVAGTLDRIFQLPDGSLVIGDLKTGSDLSYGEMEIEVQLALYAHGVNTHGLFDWNTKTWQRYAGVSSALGADFLEVRTDIAIVVHLPADGDGCTLYVADIERGWRDAQRLGPLQSSLKEKSRFRTLTAADLAPRATHQLSSPEYLATRTEQMAPADAAHANDQWEHAKHLFSTAGSQAQIAQLYQYAMDSGLFHTDQLAVLVGLGKDRLNALARG